MIATVGASAGANVVGGAVNNTIQGKAITFGSVVKDAAVGAAAGVAGKLLDKGINALQTASTTKTLTGLASQAKANVSLTGLKEGEKGFGIAAHSQFKNLVDGKGLKNVATEQSYKNGRPVAYGTAGSSRADVVLKNSNGTVKNVFDLKTGGATLSDKQTNNYIKNIPGITKPDQIKTIR